MTDAAAGKVEFKVSAPPGGKTTKTVGGGTGADRIDELIKGMEAAKVKDCIDEFIKAKVQDCRRARGRCCGDDSDSSEDECGSRRARRRRRSTKEKEYKDPVFHAIFNGALSTVDAVQTRVQSMKHARDRHIVVMQWIQSTIDMVSGFAEQLPIPPTTTLQKTRVLNTTQFVKRELASIMETLQDLPLNND